LPARHTGAEVPAMRTENDDRAAGHVLTGVIADPFDDGDGARVADTEPLPCGAGDVELASGRAVEHGVPGQAWLTGVAHGWRDCDPAAAHRLADVVVGVPHERKLDARGEEGAEALAGGALEARPHAPSRSTVSSGERARQPSTDRAVGIGD